MLQYLYLHSTTCDYTIKQQIAVTVTTQRTWTRPYWRAPASTRSIVNNNRTNSFSKFTLRKTVHSINGWKQYRWILAQRTEYSETETIHWWKIKNKD